MPYLKIKTNLPLSKAKSNRFLEEASSQISAALGKPENYFMGSVEPEIAMIFAGKHQPAACLELYSLDLPETKTAALSSVICDMVNHELEIPTERIYIKFINVERGMWGWSRGLF